MAIFQNIPPKFLDALAHLQIHPASVDDSKATTPRVPPSWDHLKCSFWLGEIVMSILEVGGQVGIAELQLTK